MLRGLWTLTWLEIKIFMREPLGAIGMVAIPVVVFMALTRLSARVGSSAAATAGDVLPAAPPVAASLLIAVNAVVSLVTIISIYREGGILKRLRATPLRPHTILTAHVIVKLLLTALTFGAMLLAGRRYSAGGAHGSLAAYAVALLISSWSVLSIGFVIASVVPTARFAQPLAGALLYPLLGISGVFFSIDILPPLLQVVAHISPVTHAASLLQGIWVGHAWSAHVSDLIALVVTFVVCIAVSSRLFRWE